MAKKATAKRKRGPAPQRLKLKGTFESVTRAFLSKKKPPEGWPPMPPRYAKREDSEEE